MIRPVRTERNSFAVMRRRLIRETEAALLAGLEPCARFRRIPAREVGKGAFTAEFAKQFWLDALDVTEADLNALAGAYTAESTREPAPVD